MSKPMIEIGNKLTKKSCKELSKQLVSIYAAANKYRISDEVVKASIAALINVSEIKNLSISHNSFVGGSKAIGKTE